MEVISKKFTFLQKIKITNKIKMQGGRIMSKKLLSPKNDYVFKRIFGWEGNEDITGDLISSIMEEEIKDVNLDCNKILERDLVSDKLGILDIKAKIGNNMECDIELQIADRKNIAERILYYWSKMYSKSVKIGTDYIKAKKTVVILITDYELEELRELEEMLSKWRIKEINNPKITLTDKLEFYILELPKIKEESKINEKLNKWIKFIRSPEALKMEDLKDKYIKKAMEELEKLGDSEEEQERAFQRELFIMDLKAIEARGIDKGEKNTKIEIAKKMKKLRKPVEEIIELTELTKEEIEKL